ncbi:fluoride efflux transporter CrcB [Tumebacillus algifaecis]|nr:fluoride efflux transporter CrcB [Tumebacillus algifaecis]
MEAWLAVLLGGALGAPLRYGLGQLIIKRWSGAWPLPTFLVNVLGSFCMGLLVAVTAEGTLRWFLGTGVLGAFTTFSTFGVEAVTLWERGRTGLAIAYVLASACIGIGAAGLGYVWNLGW